MEDIVIGKARTLAALMVRLSLSLFFLLSFEACETVPAPVPASVGEPDAQVTALHTDALVWDCHNDLAYSDEDVRKIMGGNLLRVWKAVTDRN